mmetsp:Transcript_88371/g.245318  ORF Transcript_88371/g.245318 Transcript_88371/m.245318 type:complete len:250 (+) Transcript_88371:727-1476(+)
MSSIRTSSRRVEVFRKGFVMFLSTTSLHGCCKSTRASRISKSTLRRLSGVCLTCTHTPARDTVKASHRDRADAVLGEDGAGEGGASAELPAARDETRGAGPSVMSAICSASSWSSPSMVRTSSVSPPSSLEVECNPWVTVTMATRFRSSTDTIAGVLSVDLVGLSGRLLLGRLSLHCGTRYGAVRLRSTNTSARSSGTVSRRRVSRKRGTEVGGPRPARALRSPWGTVTRYAGSSDTSSMQASSSTLGC